MILRKPIRLLFAIAVCGSAAADDKGVLPPPEAGFVSDAHRAQYEGYPKRLADFEAAFEKERAALEKGFVRTLSGRLFDLAESAEPGRVRELRELTSLWVDDAGRVEIGAEVPAELADVVTGLLNAIELRDEKRQWLRRNEYFWTVRKIDELALSHEKAGELETMRQLRAEARALMERFEVEAKYGELELTSYEWGAIHYPTFVRMQRGGGDPELISFARITGNFVGGGEWMKVQVWDEGGLPGMQAHSMQAELWATVYALGHPGLKMDRATVRVDEIGARNPRKKLIHSSRGFCYLGGIVGWFGDLTHGEVTLDPDDGFYYLSGRFEDRSTYIQAVVVEYPEGEAPEFEMSFAEWRRGDPARELLAAEDGICLMSGISGAFKGGGEEVRLIIDAEGRWRLEGKSNMINTGAKAMVLKFKG